MSRLTPRHRLFLAKYRESGYQRPGDAYRAAGYPAKEPEKSAHVLLQRPEIQAELAKMQEEDSNRSKLTIDWLIQELKDTLATAKANKDTPNVLRALENLGKTMGAFIDRQESIVKNITVAPETETRFAAELAAALSDWKVPAEAVLTAMRGGKPTLALPAAA